MTANRPARAGRTAGVKLLTTSLLTRRRALWWLAVWSVIEAIPALASGCLVATALDDGFLVGQPLVGLTWLALLGVAHILGGLATRQTFAPLAALVEPLRDDLTRMVVSSQLHHPDPPLHHADSTVVTRVVDQVESVRTLTASLLRTLRPSAMAIVAALAGIATLDADILLIVVPPLLIALGLYFGLLRLLAARQRAVIWSGEHVSGTAGSLLDGLRDVIACGADAQAKQVTGDAVDTHADHVRRLARAGAVRTLVVTTGGFAPIVILLATAPWLLGRQVTIGEITGAVVYLIVTLQPALQSLAQIAGSWGLQLTITADHLARTCAYEPSRLTQANPLLRPRSANIDVHNLAFSYGSADEPVVTGLDLEIVAGEHLAIIGATGAGKSTLVSLLSGLVAPQSGEIRLGGVPLQAVDPAELRRNVALIPQQAYVFSGTLRDNLMYLNPAASDAQLDQAIEVFKLDRVVRRLGGYDAVIPFGGAGLSAGERQLIALARVYLTNAQIVLLDEATCHLDPATEAHVEQAFVDRNSTLVVVAHRISSAFRANRILLLDGPGVVIGSHRQLLSQSARYAALVNHWTPAYRRPTTHRAHEELNPLHAHPECCNGDQLSD